MTTQHTPSKLSYYQTLDHFIIDDDEGTEGIAKVYDEDIAAFIVRACNSHYELLEALKEITDRFERLEQIYFVNINQKPDGKNGSVTRAKQAIAKAESEVL